MAERAELRPELEGIRQCLFTMLVSLAAGAREPEAKGEESQLQQVLWVCVRELDSVLMEPPPEVDLTADDPVTQQRLYEYVAGVHFTPALAHDPGDVFIPGYTPEEAGLQVYFEKGRWFATWIKLEEDANLPEAERRALLVIERNESETGLVLQDV